MNQIAHMAHAMKFIDAKRYNEGMAEFKTAVRKITEAVILPQKLEQAAYEQRSKENKNEVRVLKITDIPINKLHHFEGHPYKVLDDEEMDDLTESVRENGILSPLIVRPLEGTENEYEVISGHRRLRAMERAGMQSVPAFVWCVYATK